MSHVSSVKTGGVTGVSSVLWDKKCVVERAATHCAYLAVVGLLASSPRWDQFVQHVHWELLERKMAVSGSPLVQVVQLAPKGVKRAHAARTSHASLALQAHFHPPVVQLSVHRARQDTCQRRQHRQFAPHVGQRGLQSTQQRALHVLPGACYRRVGILALLLVHLVLSLLLITACVNPALLAPFNQRAMQLRAFFALLVLFLPQGGCSAATLVLLEVLPRGRGPVVVCHVQRARPQMGWERLL